MSGNLDENQIIATYKALQAECQQYMAKISELEVDLNEHKLVEETLKPLDPSRRSYRLIGGVLVERTVGEVLPSLSANRTKLEEVLTNLESTLTEKQKETNEWKLKYNIRVANNS